MMRKIMAVVAVAAVLGLGSCAAAEAMPSKALAAVTSQQVSGAVVIIKDENKKITTSEAFSFDERSNEVAAIPTHIGGNIQLKINDSVYDVCYAYGDLALEKDSHVYELWDNNLQSIVEEAAGTSLDALCEYTVTMNEQTFTVDGWTRKTVFDILTSVFDSQPVDDLDKQGECVRFENRLGADFDLYMQSDTIYSPYLDACFDASAYHGDFSGILSSLD